MRIIGGIAKGRKLCTLKGISVRPTSEKVREAVFNILGIKCHYKNVLDLFAGTGAMGIEALSRGAERAVFVEGGKSAAGLIKKNLDICRFTDKAVVIKMDVISFLTRKVSAFILQPLFFDIIFIDPPYHAELTEKVLGLIDNSGILARDGIAVSETSKRKDSKPILSNLEGFDERRYGDTIVTFYKNRVLYYQG